MGKITGFLEHKRETPQQEKVEERINNYNEFSKDKEFGKKIITQAARCMDCGVPFCQSGCPLGNIIPEFNDAVYKESWENAYKILSSTNNFPEFTGRICPAPCEFSCVLGINQPAVTIENIEKNIAEKAFENNFVNILPPSEEERLNYNVAIIGSGPAGLACADQLNSIGYNVTVYEREDEIGGLLRYGIPDFKLDKNVVKRRVDVLSKRGIKFITKCYVGKDVKGSDFLDKYDAIVLAIGSTIPRGLDIPGKDLKGVHFAMDFLTANNKKVAGKNPKNFISAKDKNVIVIGGGDTGSDCIGTSNRHGAKSVTQFEILEIPPKERTPDMPWPQYPRLLKETSSHEEGCKREFSILTKEFIGNDKGELTKLKTVKVEWVKTEKGLIPKEIPNSEKIYDADLVLLAMGFLHPEQTTIAKDLELEFTNRGNIYESNFNVKNTKIFACGDARRGQSLVVWAIHEGRECAVKVDEYIRKTESKLARRDSNLLIKTN